MCFTGFTEFCQDDGTSDAAVRGDRERIARMGVEPVEDLDMSAVGQPAQLHVTTTQVWQLIKDATSRNMLCHNAVR